MINFFCPKLGKCFDVSFAFFLYDGPPKKKKVPICQRFLSR